MKMTEKSSDKRKIIALGHSLGITLPNVWCSKNNIAKGDSISIYEKEDALCIYPIVVKPIEPTPETEEIDIQSLIRNKLAELRKQEL